MPNCLADETSPYLLQHKDNPVHWYPWGEEALQKAKAEDKPIFLSIGYAACHWCHVMEHESFESEATAALMNEHFVSIKVDREERPDLDSIYMQAVVAMTGHGGWPMSVWLTPGSVPFYGGTYFPPEPRSGMPGFPDVIRGVADTWENRREEALQGGQKVLEHVTHNEIGGLISGAGAGDLQTATLDQATQAIWRGFDWRNGGWGPAPKFPQPMTIEFLFRQHHRTGDPLALEMAEKTLQAMANGGMYDQLGGGFHRYAVDDHWLVPHFEKMLYDNSQLARVYLHAYQVTGKLFYRRIVEEICDYVLREMTDSQGGFYSTQDADSEGEEGKFFVWTPDEVQAVLGENAALFMTTYDVTPHGNFEGRSIPNVKLSPADLAEHFGLAEDEVQQRLAAAKRKLWEVREQRVKPGRDDKVLTGWNGLMLAAMAEAARVLARKDYAEAAIHNAEFLLGTMRTPEGRLYRTWRQGSAPKLNAYLEDYANLAEGLLELYQTTLDERWFAAARELVEAMVAHFADESSIGFFDTSDDHEALVTRPKNMQDNATPSGNAMAITVLLKLAAYTGERRYQELAEAALRPIQAAALQYPTAFAQWLQALWFAIGGVLEIAIVGDPQAPDTQALLAEVQRPYRPHQVVAVARPGAELIIPLLAERTPVDGKATAYVCQHFACQLPVTEVAALREQLGSGPS
jgi:uncharacterized protein YyaL (SSP411 family)